MTWELALIVASAAPSAAAVVIVGIWSTHRRWAAARADKAAAECAHLWSRWEHTKTIPVFAGETDNIPVDRRRMHTRTCEVCGDIEIKTWSDQEGGWI